MSQLIRPLSVSLLLIATSACTQAPAVVDIRGQDTYGKSKAGLSNYAASTPNADSGISAYQPPPVYTNMAPVTNISSNDIAPPVKPATVPAPVSKPTAIVSEPTSVPKINPWTKKPRAMEEAAAEPIVKKTTPVKLTPRSVNEAFMWPVGTKKVISAYGPKGGGLFNDGINIASSQGEPVWAAADGEVVYAGNELKGYGNMVLLKHQDGKSTAYAHLSRATVDKYEHVKQGDIIGYVGSTGNVKEPQLHFAIRDGKESVDPMKYLSRNVAGL